MANEQTYRIRFEADTQPLQAAMPSMVSQVGQAMQATAGMANQAIGGMSNSLSFGGAAMQGSLGSLQLGGAYASQSLLGSARTLGGAYNSYTGMRQGAISSHSDQVYAGARNAAMFTQDHSSSMISGAGVGAANFAGVFGSGMMIGGADLALGKAMGGASFGGFAAMGVRGGSAIGKAMGFGKFGSSAMKLAGAASGMMIPYMVGEAAVSAMTEDIVKTNEISRSINTMDVSNDRSMANTGKGRFSSKDRQGMAKFVMSLSGEIDGMDFGQGKMGVQGLTSVLSGMQKEIFSDPQLSPSKFREVFTKKVKQVREFAMAFDKSIGEAVDGVKMMNKLGFANATQGAGLLGVTGRFAGVSSQGMVGVAASGGNTFAANELGRGAGARIAVHAASDVGTMARMGILDQGDMQRLGGSTGAAKQIVGAQASFMNNAVGQTMLAAAVRGGQVNGGTIDDIISGKIGVAGMLNKSSGIAQGGVGALSDFYANKEKYARSLSASQQVGLLGTSAIQMLNVSGMSSNQSNLQTVFKSQFGMSGTMARVMAQRISNPEIIRKQMDSTTTQMMSRASAADRASKPVWLGGQRMMEGIGGMARGMGRWLRQEVSNPVGSAIHSMSKGAQDAIDILKGDTRLTMSASMNNFDVIGRDITGSSAPIEDIQRGALDAGSDAVTALAGRVREESGAGNAGPEWLQLLDKATVKMPGGSAVFSRGMLNKQEYGQVMSGIRQRESVEKKIRSGKRMSVSDVRKRWGDAFAGRDSQKAMEYMRTASEGGRITSVQAARAAIRSGAFGIAPGTSLSDLNNEQAAKLGGLIKFSGVQVDDRGVSSTNLDAKGISLMQEQGEKAQSKITDYFSTSWRLIGNADAKGEPMEFMFGRKFSKTAADMGKGMQRNITELLAIVSNNDGKPTSKKRALALASKIELATENAPPERRNEIMKIVNLARNIGKDDSKWVDSTKLEALRKGGFSKKALELVGGARKLETVAAAKAVGRQYAQRIGFELDSSIRRGDVKSVATRIQREGGDPAKMNELVKAAQGLASGDVTENLMNLGKKANDKSFNLALEAMKNKGGAVGRIATLTKNLGRVRSLQEGDLLKGLSSQDKVTDKLLSGDSFAGAMKSETTAKAQLEKIKESLNKGKFRKQAPAILEALKGFKTQRGKLKALQMIGKGGGSDERGQLARMILGDSTAKTSGKEVVGSSPLGAFSKVADAQIKALHEQQMAFASMLRVVEQLHEKMKRTPSIKLR